MRTLKFTLFIGLGMLFFSCNGNDNANEKADNMGKTTYSASNYEKKIKKKDNSADSIKNSNIEFVVDTWSNGNKRKVFYFSDSTFSNLVYEVEYYENGIKKIEGGYKDGLKEGKWTAWYENDTIWSIGFYKNGKKHGLSAVYYPNGIKYYDKNFVNDVAEGKWNYYSEEGALIAEVYYHNGVIIKEVKY